MIRLLLALLLLSDAFPDGSAREVQPDPGEDLVFEVQPLTRLHLKNGRVLEGRMAAAEAEHVHLKQGSVTHNIPTREIERIEPERSPEACVAEQFKEHPDRTNTVARKALRVFRDNRDVERVVAEHLRNGAESRDPDSLALLVELELNAGRPREAGEHARALVKLRDSGWAQALLGRALSAQPDQRTTAEKAFTKALQWAPDNADVLLAAAEFFLNTSRTESAAVLFTQVLERRPDAVAAGTGVGLCCLRQGDLEHAVAHFERVRATVAASERRERHYIQASLGLAAAHALVREFVPAKQLAAEVLAIDTDNASALGLQAYIDLMAGETGAQALAKADIALKSDPRNPRLKALKVVALARKGEWLKATEHLQEAKANFAEAARILVAIEDPENPNDSWAAYLMGNVCLDQQAYEMALKAFQGAVELEPGYAPAHQAVGATWLRLRNWSEAEKAYRKALSLDNQTAEYTAGVGLALLGQGRVVEARERLKAAWQMERHCIEAICGLAYIANLEKNEAATRELFHMALGIDGECAYAIEGLRKVYSTQGITFEHIDFRDRVPEDWHMVGGAGVPRPMVREAVLRWNGTSGPEGTSRNGFHATLDVREFIYLEADLAAALERDCVVALCLRSTVGALPAFYLEFGRDPDNRLSYRLRDADGQREWTPVSPWPDTGKVRLGIGSSDLSNGRIRLYVDGEPKLQGNLNLPPRTRISAGVFLQAPPNRAVDAWTDNIVLVSRRTVPARPEHDPLAPAEQPDALIFDRPAEGH